LKGSFSYDGISFGSSSVISESYDDISLIIIIVLDDERYLFPELEFIKDILKSRE